MGGTSIFTRTLKKIGVFRRKIGSFLPNWSPEIKAAEAEPEKKERLFGIFMDYRNLEMHLKRTSRDKLNDFSWLLDPILSEGKIILSFVFIPSHYTVMPPVMQLTRLHHFIPVVCPRQISGAVTKDRDSVDNQMESLTRDLVEYSILTDFVIVSGDADFAALATFAQWRQKRVHIVSTLEALSGRFMEMHRSGAVKVRLVE